MMTQVNKATFIQPYLSPLSFLQSSDWLEILVVSTSKRKFAVRVNNKEVASVQAQFSNEDFKEYYIGGAPQDMRERYVVIRFSLNHCAL